MYTSRATTIVYCNYIHIYIICMALVALFIYTATAYIYILYNHTAPCNLSTSYIHRLAATAACPLQQSPNSSLII